MEERKAARCRTIFAGAASLAIHAVLFGILSILSAPTLAEVGTNLISVDLGSGAGSPISPKTMQPGNAIRKPSLMANMPSPNVPDEAPQADPLGDRIVEGAAPASLPGQATALQGGEDTGAASAGEAAKGRRGLGGQGEGGTERPSRRPRPRRRGQGDRRAHSGGSRGPQNLP